MPDFITVREASDRLHFHQQTIYKMIKNGILPANRIGNRLRISREGLERYIAGTQEKTNPKQKSEVLNNTERSDTESKQPE
jgi:excisionase family DNA binding protein